MFYIFEKYLIVNSFVENCSSLLYWMTRYLAFQFHRIKWLLVLILRNIIVSGSYKVYTKIFGITRSPNPSIQLLEHLSRIKVTWPITQIFLKAKNRIVYISYFLYIFLFIIPELLYYSNNKIQFLYIRIFSFAVY